MICKLELSTIEKKNSDWSKFVPKNHTQAITSKVHFEIIILYTDLPTPIWTMYTYKKSRLGWAGLYVPILHKTECLQ